jgi:hypothetical protein
VLSNGSGQTAQLGKAFAANLAAQLANSNGCAITGNLAGINVTFEAPASGPSGIFPASGSRLITVGTDAQGAATAPPFTANDLAGSYRVEATSGYGSVGFDLGNTAAGVAAAITATGGGGQAATTYGEYTEPLQARVTDIGGSPVQGASVTFSIAPGSTGAGATFLGASQAVATTNASGVATSPLLLANGNAGRFTAVASTDGVPGAASFVLDNHAATQRLLASNGTGQRATVDTAYPSPLSVRLLDSNGEPIEGAAVTFRLGSQESSAAVAGPTPGATFDDGTNQAIAFTDADGLATSPAITANSAAGSFTATAALVGSAPVVFALRNLLPRLRLVMHRRSATVGKAFGSRLVATVEDSGGRPIQNASVVFAVSSTSGAGASFPDGDKQATVTTDRGGRGIAPLLAANRTAGTFTVTAQTVGFARPVQIRLHNHAGRAATVTIGVASGLSSECSTAFPVPLAVTVADRYGNRLQGARVAFTAPARGASGSFAVVHGRQQRRKTRTVTVATNSLGIAVAPRFTANQHVGAYLVRARVKGSPAKASFVLSNTPRQ